MGVQGRQVTQRLRLLQEEGWSSGQTNTTFYTFFLLSSRLSHSKTKQTAIPRRPLNTPTDLLRQNKYDIRQPQKVGVLPNLNKYDAAYTLLHFSPIVSFFTFGVGYLAISEPGDSHSESRTKKRRYSAPPPPPQPPDPVRVISSQNKTDMQHPVGLFFLDAVTV